MIEENTHDENAGRVHINVSELRVALLIVCCLGIAIGFYLGLAFALH